MFPLSTTSNTKRISQLMLKACFQWQAHFIQSQFHNWWGKHVSTGDHILYKVSFTIGAESMFPLPTTSNTKQISQLMLKACFHWQPHLKQSKFDNWWWKYVSTGNHILYKASLTIGALVFINPALHSGVHVMAHGYSVVHSAIIVPMYHMLAIGGAWHHNAALVFINAAWNSSRPIQMNSKWLYWPNCIQFLYQISPVGNKLPILLQQSKKWLHFLLIMRNGAVFDTLHFILLLKPYFGMIEGNWLPNIFLLATTSYTKIILQLVIGDVTFLCLVQRLQSSDHYLWTKWDHLSRKGCEMFYGTDSPN